MANIFGVWRILLPMRQRYINFSNPFSARHWLKLLIPHPRFGLVFRSSLDIEKTELGFSFRSNSLGFRGPLAVDGDNVLMGTSFAMGLSVDNGRNWYDGLLDEKNWFNVGMPVGPENHKAVLDDLYVGGGKTLLYLYHPNVWKTAAGFVEAQEKACNIYSLLGWKTDLSVAVKRYPIWVFRELAKAATGASLYARWDRRPFYFNCRYNWFDTSKGEPFVRSQIEVLNDIFSRFERIIVVRTPIKEDSVPTEMNNQNLIKLRKQYDFYWELLKKETLHKNVNFYGLESNCFSCHHFLQFDTHWSEEGNRHFARLAREILLKEGVSGVL